MEYNVKQNTTKRLRQILYKQYLVNQQIANNPFLDEYDYFCVCAENRANKIKQGWNDPSQTQNQRISQIITGTLGGKTTFGNFNRPTQINYTGGWEGQPGGMPRPPRNRF
jgi:hypothetical protein